MKIYNFNEFIKESTDEELLDIEKNKVKNVERDSIINKYNGIQKDLMGVIFDNTKSTNVEKNTKFIVSVINKGFSDQNIINLNQDSDFFEFYLKFQLEIDSILSENVDFFSKKYTGINSLYGYVVKGTKIALIEELKKLKESI